MQILTSKRHLMRGIVAGLLVLGQFAFTTLFAGDFSEYIREHYTKYEYRIPMRDGVRLFTTVYVPKDKSRT
ncbi:MAG TPA: X-Pro dipeptidyl-peptidase, partial [Bacteroidetes bacterium]|nr:X-Pro dipeptidyl-peptidase [Bacteroidota bacterium]